MDVERLRQVLRELPAQVDDAAAQLKAVAAQVESQIDALAPLIERFIPDEAQDFVNKFKAPQAPVTREVKTEWLVNNLENVERADLVELPDEIFDEIYTFWKDKLG